MKNLDKWLKSKLHLNPKKEIEPKVNKTEVQPSLQPKNVEIKNQAPKPPYKRDNYNSDKRDQKPKPFPPEPSQKPYLRIIPLGGLEHIGRNMNIFETEKDIVIVDCGLEFSSDGVFGIDYLIPDVSYLEQKKDKIRGLVITHGHLDHIGAIHHVLPKIGYPTIFGSELTIGFIGKQLEEHKLTQNAKLASVNVNDVLKLGAFTISFARITHSIPGAFVVTIDTPFGKIVNTGDFKLDVTAPFPSDIPDFSKLASWGAQGIFMMLADSTNVTIEGFARPEIEIGETLDQVIGEAKGRVIIGCFASNIARIQQIIDAALHYNRNVYLSGRSMIANAQIAHRLHWLKYPDNAVMKMSKNIETIPDEKVLIISTGSQGEEFSALSRMATDKHTQIQIRKGDTMIFSSNPIRGTGNDRAVYNMINAFMEKGAKVITNDDLDVYTSGHGRREDLRLMLKLIRPKYFLPVHGEPYMRESHKNLANEEGVTPDNIFVMHHGDMLECTSANEVKVVKEAFDLKRVYIDGLGGTESEDGERVIEERKIMAKEGLVMVLYKVLNKDRSLLGAPKLISKGFMYLEEMEDLQKALEKEAKRIYLECVSDKSTQKQKEMRFMIRKQLGKIIYQKINREPLIVPVIIEI